MPLQIPSPCYVLEETLLRKNLTLMERVQKETGVKIICALKGFSFWHSFPMLSQYLAGATASSLWEMKLAQEEFKKEIHVYSPLYNPHEMDELLDAAKHISFNNLNEWSRYKERVTNSKASPGIRINPETSSVECNLYNPCKPGSRLGEPIQGFLDKEDSEPDLLTSIEGLHFHALCEENCDALSRVLDVFEENFKTYLPKMKWVNFGGGHHITRKDYDVEGLIQLLKSFQSRHPHLEILLEPGEAIGWETGYLTSTVLDIQDNLGKTAMLDISFAAHMPDCLEMPYRPEVRGAGKRGEKKIDYRLGGNTCLSGDFLSDFSFDSELEIGQTLIFEDMIHYTMVKTTFFNGVQHPSIATKKENGELVIHRTFDYSDFKSRLG